MKESIISHPPKTPLIMLRQDYLDICDQHHGAALLLGVFEYWTNVKLSAQTQTAIENRLRRKAGLPLIPDDLWIYKTNQDLLDDCLGLLKLYQIKEGLSILSDKEYLLKRNNPNFKWDRTLQYLLQYQVVQLAIDNLSIGHIQPMDKLQVTDQSVTDDQAIPEITSETTIKEKDASINFDDLFPEKDHPKGEAHVPLSSLDSDALAEMIILKAGRVEGDQAIQSAQSQLVRAEWLIHDDEVRNAVIYFLAATGWDVPMSKSERGLWITTKKNAHQIPDHVETFGLSSLYDLYQKAWAKLKDGDLTIGHPGAFYNTMLGLKHSKEKPAQELTPALLYARYQEKMPDAQALELVRDYFNDQSITIEKEGE